MRLTVIESLNLPQCGTTQKMREFLASVDAKVAADNGAEATVEIMKFNERPFTAVLAYTRDAAPEEEARITADEANLKKFGLLKAQAAYERELSAAEEACLRLRVVRK